MGAWGGPCGSENAQVGRPVLLADAEGGEDSVQDVVRRGRSRDGVDRTQGRVQIEQQHLVGNPELQRAAGLLQGLHGLAEQMLVADAGDETGVFAGDRGRDLPPQVVDPFSGKGRHGDEIFRHRRHPRQVGLLPAST